MRHRRGLRDGGLFFFSGPSTSRPARCHHLETGHGGWRHGLCSLHPQVTTEWARNRRIGAV